MSFARTSLIGLCSALSFVVGCSGVPTSEEGDANSVSSAVQSAWPTFIVLSGSQTVSNATLTLRDLGSSNTDSEAVRIFLYPQGGSNPHNQALMNWTSTAGNLLQLSGFGQGIYPEYPTWSSIKIQDYGNRTVTRMRVTLRGYVGGDCYEDYEDIDWQTPPLLYFNPNKDNPGGTCYNGNLLRKSP